MQIKPRTLYMFWPNPVLERSPLAYHRVLTSCDDVQRLNRNQKIHKLKSCRSVFNIFTFSKSQNIKHLAFEIYAEFKSFCHPPFWSRYSTFPSRNFENFENNINSFHSNSFFIFILIVSWNQSPKRSYTENH